MSITKSRELRGKRVVDRAIEGRPRSGESDSTHRSDGRGEEIEGSSEWREDAGFSVVELRRAWKLRLLLRQSAYGIKIRSVINTRPRTTYSRDES